MHDWRKDYEPGGKLYPLVLKLEEATKRAQERERLGLPREIVYCKWIRSGPGCGHDVQEHIGPDSPNQDCRCCSWRQNA